MYPNLGVDNLAIALYSRARRSKPIHRVPNDFSCPSPFGTKEQETIVRKKQVFELEKQKKTNDHNSFR